MSTLKVNTLTDTAATKSVPIEDVTNGVARAWANFNGTGTVAIRASYNVSSITDNGTGDYTVNFTTAMPDANYSANMSTRYTTNGSNIMGAYANSVSTNLTGSIRIYFGPTGAGTGGQVDSDFISVSVFR
jgi:hypothetical protein